MFAQGQLCTSLSDARRLSHGMMFVFKPGVTRGQFKSQNIGIDALIFLCPSMVIFPDNTLICVENCWKNQSWFDYY